MKEETRKDGILVAVCGASRFGKTRWVLERIARASRLLVWDPRGEYVRPARCTLVQSIPVLAAALREHAQSEGRFAYFGPVSDFERFCGLAYTWVQLWPAVVVLEEAADATQSGRARYEHGELIRKGLYYGAHLYAITQRPQETDKTTWGNATVKHCHFLDLPIDREYMGAVLGVSPEKIGELARGQWIEKRVGVPAHIFGP